MGVTEQLNETAMKIILHAGNGRQKIHQGIQLSLEDVDGSKKEEVLALLKEGKKDITMAHRVQTEVMQTFIEDNVAPTILFSHAQDTLMTIIAESNMAKYIVELNYKMIGVK